MNSLNPFVRSTLDVLFSVFFAIVAIMVSYRMVTDIPSGGFVEQFLRYGLTALGCVVIVAWILMLLNYITGLRK
jgi:hypothetical protein